MSKTIDISWEEARELARACAAKIKPANIPQYDGNVGTLYAYPVPNGGIPAALLVADAYNSNHSNRIILTDKPGQAYFCLDDIIDSGATRNTLVESYRPFFALVDKLGDHKDWAGRWVSFPWERMQKQDGPQDNIRRILQFIGEDPTREGLRETPDRVVRSYKELFAGYQQDPETVFKTFEDGRTDEMVLLRDVSFTSNCEHHMLPFMGVAHIAYLPRGKIIGVSKLARLLEVFARRLQVQERLCQQITEALDKHLNPLGSACVIEATHLCMTCRGISKTGSKMITSSLTGVFRKDPAARWEFMHLIK